MGVAALAATLAGCAETNAVANPSDGAPKVLAVTPEATGRYVVEIGGCNDCHTDGYMDVDGAVDEADWLTGSIVGFRGPWGTTYPPNLRLTAQSMSEDQWAEMLATRKGLPPMPWPSVNRMNDADRRAIHRFLRSLGVKGEAATAALPPDAEPAGPWIDFFPHNLPEMASTAN